jgi:outer membrane protein OmpA-like peptidoglycan-associated protein
MKSWSIIDLHSQKQESFHPGISKMSYSNILFCGQGAITRWFLICLFSFSSVAYGQQSMITNLTSFEKSGDRKFYLFSYKAAAHDYEQALNQNPEKEYLKIKIAECYRLLNEPLLVEKWYAQTINNNQLVKPEHKMHYAQALSSNGKYQEAKKWLESYQQDINNDSRVGKKIAAIDNLDQLLKDSMNYVIVPLNINSTESDFSPAYYKDGIVFVSARNQFKAKKTIFAWNESQFLDLYYSQESENGSNLAPRLFHQNVNTSLHEGPTVFYEDESKMIFTRNNLLSRKQGESQDGVVKLKLYTSFNNKEGEAWSMPEPLPFNSDEYSTGHPAITNDGNTLYFASDMPGGFGGTDIYRSIKEGNTWSTPENLGAEINTEGDEVFPFIYDRDILYYSSNGMGGLGGLDIFRADLSSKIVRNVGAPINSAADDFGAITKDDGETGYFSSNRKQGRGSDDIYYFNVIKKVIEIIVYDYETGELLPGADVRLFDAETERNRSVTAPDGSSDLVVNPRKNYVIKVSRNNYMPSEGKLESSIFMNKNILQIRIPLIQQLSSEPLEFDSLKTILEFTPGVGDVQVKVNSPGIPIRNESASALNSRIKIYQVINRTGIQEIAVKDNTAYLYNKDNNSLSSKTGGTLISLKEPLPLDLNERQQQLDKLFDELNISVQYQLIQNIYYDFNKSYIRNDASAILDHLVNLMLDCPELNVQLTSHTDSRGSVVYNKTLSKRRADSARTYLLNEGIESHRIEAGWFGEEQLAKLCGNIDNCDEESHQLNRRTEIAIVFK